MSRVRGSLMLKLQLDVYSNRVRFVVSEGAYKRIPSTLWVYMKTQKLEVRTKKLKVPPGLSYNTTDRGKSEWG